MPGVMHMPPDTAVAVACLEPRALCCQITPRRSRRWPIMLIVAVLVAVSAAEALKAFVLRSRFSKVDIARLTMKSYAYDAYPQWSARNPDRVCPRSIEELIEYMHYPDPKDPWGGNYRMFCGRKTPAGVRPIAFTSDGADGVEGTADDIRSWE